MTIRQAPRWLFSGNSRKAADRFVQSLGYKPLGERWHDLRAEKLDGIAGLTAFLERDMAYGMKVLPPEDAQAIAQQFFSYFQTGEVTHLANRISAGWNSITTSTFEAAFIAMDADSIGLFLIEDED